MVREQWSAKIVDSTDIEAVQSWARGMCEGLKLEEINRVLNIEEPTVASVAQRLTSGMPESAEAVARKTCEEELRKANKGS